MIIGVDHINLGIAPGEEDIARAYYCELLGLTEIPKPEPLRKNDGLWLQLPDMQLHLSANRDHQPDKKAHIALTVSDFDQLRRLLASQGFAYEADHQLKHRRLFTFDPFGNRLELIQQH